MFFNQTTAESLQEVLLKVLCLLFMIFFISLPLNAQEISSLRELEQAQEKIWYLQRDVKKAKIRLEEQQKQLDSLNALVNKEIKHINEEIRSFSEETETQKEKTNQTVIDLKQMGEALHALYAEVKQQNERIADQTETIQGLEHLLTMLDEREKQKNGASEELLTIRDQLSSVRSQTAENQAQLAKLEKNMSDQIKKLGYWGTGIALLFAILLTFTMIMVKNKNSPN